MKNKFLTLLILAAMLGNTGAILCMEEAETHGVEFLDANSDDEKEGGTEGEENAPVSVGFDNKISLKQRFENLFARLALAENSLKRKMRIAEDNVLDRHFKKTVGAGLSLATLLEIYAHHKIKGDFAASKTAKLILAIITSPVSKKSRAIVADARKKDKALFRECLTFVTLFFPTLIGAGIDGAKALYNREIVITEEDATAPQSQD